MVKEALRFPLTTSKFKLQYLTKQCLLQSPVYLREDRTAPPPPREQSLNSAGQERWGWGGDVPVLIWAAEPERCPDGRKELQGSAPTSLCLSRPEIGKCSSHRLPHWPERMCRKPLGPGVSGGRRSFRLGFRYAVDPPS